MLCVRGNKSLLTPLWKPHSLWLHLSHVLGSPCSSGLPQHLVTALPPPTNHHHSLTSKAKGVSWGKGGSGLLHWFVSSLRVSNSILQICWHNTQHYSERYYHSFHLTDRKTEAEKLGDLVRVIPLEMAELGSGPELSGSPIYALHSKFVPSIKRNCKLWGGEGTLQLPAQYLRVGTW
jgi:hypothetical protein